MVILKTLQFDNNKQPANIFNIDYYNIIYKDLFF